MDPVTSQKSQDAFKSLGRPRNSLHTHTWDSVTYIWYLFSACNVCTDNSVCGAQGAQAHLHIWIFCTLARAVFPTGCPGPRLVA